MYTWVTGDKLSPNQADHQLGRVVKRFKDGIMQSTASPEHYNSDFIILGRVVWIIHVEKIFWWRNTGSQVPSPERPRFTKEETDRFSEEAKTRKAKFETAKTKAVTGLVEDTAIVGKPKKRGCERQSIQHFRSK